MRPEHLEFLACPRCAGALRLDRGGARVEEDGHVLEGGLACAGCAARFPLARGVPRLLPDDAARSALREKTAERFGEEWRHFRDFQVDEEEASLKTWFRPRRLEDLAGLSVLEAGCGMGRHATIACRYGVKTIVGLDLGDAVDAAFENTRHLSPVCIVQGDIYCPPVRRGAFDAAFSLGVLHHLPEPDRGFQALAAAVRDDGWFQVWVYGREGNGWIVHLVDPIRRWTSRLPFGALSALSLALSAPLLLSAKTLYRLPWLGPKLPYAEYVRWLAPFRLRKVHAIVLDHAVAPVAHYLGRGDVENMVEGAGWTIEAIEHSRGMSWGASARRRARDLGEAANGLTDMIGQLRSLLDDYWKHSGGTTIDEARAIARAHGFGFELGRVSRFENVRNSVVVAKADLREDEVNRILLAEEIQHGLDRASNEASKAVRLGLTNEQFHARFFQRIVDGYAGGRFQFLNAEDLAALRGFIARLGGR